VAPQWTRRSRDGVALNRSYQLTVNAAFRNLQESLSESMSKSQPDPGVRQPRGARRESPAAPTEAPTKAATEAPEDVVKRFRGVVQSANASSSAAPTEVEAPLRPAPTEAEAPPRPAPFEPPAGLPRALDLRKSWQKVMPPQTGNSVGAAIAAVMDRLRSEEDLMSAVSPDMIFALGKRYDRLPPNSPSAMDGTTLDAALRGLRLHGVCLDSTWKRLKPNILTEIPAELAADAAGQRPAEIAKIPLDVSAIQQALYRDGPLVGSAQITTGWQRVHSRSTPEGRMVSAIEETDHVVGGHAFAVMGYNEIGLLVQNSDGPSWGKQGFATWPYEAVAQRGLEFWAIRLAATTSSLAGYQSDGLLGVDRLGITPDVKAIASLVTARSVSPPLAFGLFGDWGSGKSFFMERLQEQIVQRALLAQKQGAESPFCSSVVQIEFNAWHYLDANLWASLVAEIFEQLFRTVSGTPTEDQVRETIQRELSDANGLFSESRQELDAAKRRSQEAAAGLAEARAVEPVAPLTPNEAFEAAREAMAKDPVVTAQVNELASKMGATSSDELLAKLQQPIAEARTWPARLERLRSWLARRLGTGSTRQRLLRAALLALVVIAPTVVAAGLAWFVGLPSVVPTLTALVTLAVAIGSVVSKVGAWIGSFEQLSASLDEAETKKAQAILAQRQADQDAAASVLQAAEEHHRAAQARVARLEADLVDLTPARQIQRFLEERTASQAYASRLGLVSLIRRDFERLSDLMKKRAERLDRERKAAAAAGASAFKSTSRRRRPAKSPAPPADEVPIDRIVLYIDDLDRCKPRRVIEVLEAVHLLLAFRLFVVVVAVDPRWLRRCLEDQYPELLATQSPRIGGNSEGLSRTSTPQDYLEKIFQIPFYLRPMGAPGFVELVGDLVGSDIAEDGTTTDGAQLPGAAGPVAHVPASDGSAGSASTAPASPETPTVARDIQPPPTSDLDIERLTFNRWEVEDMQSLSPLFRTPRATKRFVNTYRLLRSTVPAAERTAFEGTREAPGTYRNALILLAAVAGFPNVAPQFLIRLANASKDATTTWAAFVIACKAPAVGPTLGGEMDSGDWSDLCDALGRLNGSRLAPSSIAAFRLWIPRVARYSFSVSLPSALDDLLQGPVVVFPR
jgi:hypothetical protein